MWVSAKWISANDNDVHDVYSDAAQAAVESGNRNIVDIFSIHSASNDTDSSIPIIPLWAFRPFINNTVKRGVNEFHG
ncbi:hypothetical protein Bca52824_050068 [Brassica carinata]|uniref:Uncharacterized protein n=1 Tax=Brassica carinata TaxID=52824 RepID=A0A8X7RK24_BRACI|nr:hypothetical protein Bca52824_050068 [Brassica carinata]